MKHAATMALSVLRTLYSKPLQEHGPAERGVKDASLANDAAKARQSLAYLT